jgi:orotidine-5'-phosphate decarboxylase
LLTDRDQKYIEKEYGFIGTVSEFVVKKALMVKAANGDGVICSPQEVRAIRAAIPDERFLIVTPGIRPDWSQSGGHKRAGRPAEAISGGANYLVVGRPIIQAEGGDRLAAAERIIEEMREAFDTREVR